MASNQRRKAQRRVGIRPPEGIVQVTDSWDDVETSFFFSAPHQDDVAPVVDFDDVWHTDFQPSLPPWPSQNEISSISSPIRHPSNPITSRSLPLHDSLLSDLENPPVNKVENPRTEPSLSIRPSTGSSTSHHHHHPSSSSPSSSQETITPPRSRSNECMICVQEYDTQDCVPRILTSCGHTFCQTCLIALKSASTASSSLRCPTCRIISNSSSSLVEDFPKNFALIERIERKKQGISSVVHSQLTARCDRCNQQESKFGCLTCAAKLCSRCWTKIHNVGSLRHHQKVDCDVASDSRCPLHPSRIRDMMCLEASCSAADTLICVVCSRDSSHEGHLTRPVELMAPSKRQELSELLERATSSFENASEILARVRENIQLLGVVCNGVESSCITNSSYDQARRAIHQYFDSLREAIEVRRIELLSELETKALSKALLLMQQEEELTKYLSQSALVIERANHSLSNLDDHSFMILLSNSLKSLHEVSSTPIPAQLAANPTIRVQFDSDISLNHLGQCIDRDSTENDLDQN